VICLNCNRNEGLFTHPIGWTYCQECQDKHKADRIKETIEVTSDGIKEDRKVYKTDILQPFRESSLSKEYVTKYPESVQQMVREGRVSREEVKNAKPVWVENQYYKDNE